MLQPNKTFATPTRPVEETSFPSSISNPAGLYLDLPSACRTHVVSTGSPARTAATPASLPYRVQGLLESPGHAGDQVDVVVDAAAHAALHQRADGRLLGSRVEQILGLVIAMHRAPGEAILGTARDKSGLRSNEDTKSEEALTPGGKQKHILGGCWSNG